MSDQKNAAQKPANPAEETAKVAEGEKTPGAPTPPASK